MFLSFLFFLIYKVSIVKIENKGLERYGRKYNEKVKVPHPPK